MKKAKVNLLSVTCGGIAEKIDSDSGEECSSSFRRADFAWVSSVPSVVQG